MQYFDHNATAPLLPVARDAWLKAVDDFPGNASSQHRAGQRADRAIEAARDQVARILGCHSLDLFWTSGATESANTVLHHLLNTTDPARPLWISSIEHPCVLETAFHHFGERVRLIPVDSEGAIDLNWIESELARQQPAAVAVMAANNETGVLQPWETIRDLCRRQEIPFVCDATQWLGRLPANGLGGCDYVLGSGHKFGSPKGIGFLKCPQKVSLHPLLRGGIQQEHRRAGTENIPSILAFEAALTWCEEQMTVDALQQRHQWRNDFLETLRDSLPEAAPTGHNRSVLWNTVHLALPAPDCRQRWVVKLDRAGFAVSTGSACASGSEKGSHVLLAMGRPEDQISRSIRCSGGWLTTNSEWQDLSGAIRRIWNEWNRSPASPSRTLQF